MLVIAELFWTLEIFIARLGPWKSKTRKWISLVFTSNQDKVFPQKVIITKAGYN
jgi:hypothetical protein